MKFEKTKQKEPAKALAFGKSNNHFSNDIFCRYNYQGQKILCINNTTGTLVQTKYHPSTVCCTVTKTFFGDISKAELLTPFVT